MNEISVDVGAAFSAARAAQPDWAARSPSVRAVPFLRLRDLLLDHRADILDVVQGETGKARLHASEEFLDTVASIGYYARNAPRLLRPRRRPGALPVLTQTWEYPRPRGVVATITPWNYPFALAADVIPALLAGNAVVHKPDSKTARSSLLLRDYALQAGLDPQLWQVVTGEPAEVGDALIDGADYLAFTGSTRAGTEIAKRCAERGIGCNLELGGKNAMLVLADADLEHTVTAALRACFSNAGQLCIGIERVYVDRLVYDEFLRRFATATKMLRLGNDLDYTADLGSLISADQLDRVAGMVDRAVADGARVITGGRARPDLGAAFYEPTILTDTARDAEINRTEIFGPVVTVTPVDDDAEAVRLANDSPYGLNAAVFGRDRRRARRVALRLQAGMVNINEGYAAGYASGSPVGGWKRSGTGRRHGEAGLMTYTQSQTVASQYLLGFDPPTGVTGEQYGRLLAASLRAMYRLRIR